MGLFVDRNAGMDARPSPRRFPMFRSRSTAADDVTTKVASKRWAIDPAGRTIYYPRGSAHCGYVVADVLRERAIRQADERFDGVSRQLRPLVPVLAAGLSYALITLIDSH